MAPIPTTSVDYRFSGHKEYYHVAFGTQFINIWRGIEWIRNSPREIASLCYYKSLTAFYDKDPLAIIDRRILLYSYLSKTFSITADDSTLNRYKQSLPIKSSVPRIIRNIATAYSASPTRRFSSKNDTSNTATVLKRLYDEMDVTQNFRKIHRKARLTSFVAVRPYVSNGKMVIEYMTPEFFRVTESNEDFQKIDSIIIPRFTVEHGTFYEQWDAEFYTKIDADGEVISQEPNRYGRIPYSFVRMLDGNGIYPGGMFELIESQLNSNKAALLADNNVDFASSPSWLAINLNTNNVQLSPDKLIAVEGVTEGEGQRIPPSLESISPDGRYAELDEFKNNRDREAANNEGLPYSMLGESQTPLSGISRIIERTEVIEIRSEDQDVLRAFEYEFGKLVGTVANADLALNLNLDEIEVTVDYAEERIYLEPEAEYEFDKKKMNDMVVDPMDFYKKWGGFDATLTPEQLSKIIAERSNTLAIINAAKEPINAKEIAVE